PFVFVNIQSLFPVDERSLDVYGTWTVAVAPAGRIPPSETLIVWSLTVFGTAWPSTVTVSRCSEPRRAAMVLSSRRSMGPPLVLVTTIVVRALRDRVAQLRLARTS